METSSDPGLVSLLAFWAEAGVDVAYTDDPVDRLAQGGRPAAMKAGRASPATLGATSRPVLPAPAIEGASAERELAARTAAATADSVEELESVVQGFFGETAGVAAKLGRGAHEPHVLVVGEAPSAEDEAEDRPFGGAAGRLLDRMLAAAGLLDRAYLTYAALRRPAGVGGDEAGVSAAFLARLIALARPRAMLLLGEGPARTVLDTGGGIMALRGRWLERPGEGAGAPPVPALTTFSPSFLLSQPLAKRRAWEDVLTLAARVDLPDNDA